MQGLEKALGNKITILGESEIIIKLEYLLCHICLSNCKNSKSIR
jgi:hypothetical protein